MQLRATQLLSVRIWMFWVVRIAGQVTPGVTIGPDWENWFRMRLTDSVTHREVVLGRRQKL